MNESPVNGSLTAVAGLRVGHWTHPGGATGCTVVLCPEEGCVASGSVLGGSPASRELALLAPDKLVDRVHGVVLSGGSAFGLAAANGVVQWLEREGVGYATRGGRVPIVPSACIYDLEVAGLGARPDAASGLAAAAAATTAAVDGGRVGAAAGATASVYLGYDRGFRTGIGSAAKRFRGATIAALAVCNPLGDIRDPASGEILAGHGLGVEQIATHVLEGRPGENTTLVIVATDVPLSKPHCTMLSTAAHLGIAASTHPSHTPFDGDTTFVLSTGTGQALPVGPLAILVQSVVARAVQNAARIGGVA